MVKNNGFTLIEIMVGICIIAVLLTTVFKITGFIGHNVIKETAELQNLQEVRNAINRIRRDFMVATPKYIKDSDLNDTYNVRLDPIIDSVYAGEGPQPMQVNNNSILLYKKKESGDYEQISYMFNENEQILIRNSSLNGEYQYKGIKKVEFKVYYLDSSLNPYIPLLWVSITVENGYGKTAKELTVATTLAANTICQDLNNLYWNSSL